MLQLQCYNVLMRGEGESHDLFSTGNDFDLNCLMIIQINTLGPETK